MENKKFKVRCIVRKNNEIRSSTAFYFYDTESEIKTEIKSTKDKTPFLVRFQNKISFQFEIYEWNDFQNRYLFLRDIWVS
jgi:hypothetical protein